MSTLGKRLIKDAKEGRAIARGEADPATYPPNGPPRRFGSRMAWARVRFKVRPRFPNKRLTVGRMPIEVQHNLGALFAAL
jgi:hypothetical protein